MYREVYKTKQKKGKTMKPNNFTITGHIIDRQTDRSISGLRIEAWDKDLFFDDLVGSAETDAEGLLSCSHGLRGNAYRDS